MRAIWHRRAEKAGLIHLAINGSSDEVDYARRALGLSLVPFVPSPDRDVTQERSP
jgi:hypothetical protein